MGDLAKYKQALNRTLIKSFLGLKRYYLAFRPY